jgi:spermidine/putrescine transport system substrate-binding protein
MADDAGRKNVDGQTNAANNPTTSMSRRRALAVLGGAATVSLAGCSGGGGETGDSGSGDPEFIRYLGWGGNTQDSAKQLFEGWTEETGIEVRHQSAGGDSEFLSIIQQNPGEIDIVNFSSFGIALARSEDLLADISYGDLPNYTENMQEAFQNAPYIEGNGDTVFRDPVSQGFTVNTESVDPRPTDWPDLTDSRFQGSISLRDDALSRFSSSALATGSNINEIVEAGPESDSYQAAVEHQEALHQNVETYWSAGAQAIQLLREENVTVAEMWGGRTLALEEAGYDQMEYTIAESGVSVLDENYNIPSSSEKQEAVHDLINWSFQRENAVELSTNLGYPIMINDPPESITSLPDYVDSIDALSWPDWEVVRPAIDQLQRDFQEIKQN